MNIKNIQHNKDSVTGPNIYGRIGIHIFLEKNIILCILKGILPFKMHKIIFFPFKIHKIIFLPEILKRILGCTSKFRYGRVTLNTGIFYLT